MTRRVVGLREPQRSSTPGYDWTFRGRAPVRSIAQQRTGGTWQDLTDAEFMRLCPYGAPGDRLWVRETWRTCPNHDDPTSLDSDGRGGGVVYKADGAVESVESLQERFAWEDEAPEPPQPSLTWRPSIYMPRWASRITLEVTAVRVERVQEITEPDAISEGIGSAYVSVPRAFGGVVQRFIAPGVVHANIFGERTDEAPAHLNARAAFSALWDSINGKRPGCDWVSNSWVWVISFRRISCG